MDRVTRQHPTAQFLTKAKASAHNEVFCFTSPIQLPLYNTVNLTHLVFYTGSVCVLPF